MAIKNRKYRVVVINNVYGNKPPFTNCAVVGEHEKAPPLYETSVFVGAYDECKDYIKENCESCLNCE